MWNWNTDYNCLFTSTHGVCYSLCLYLSHEKRTEVFLHFANTSELLVGNACLAVKSGHNEPPKTAYKSIPLFMPITELLGSLDPPCHYQRLGLSTLFAKITFLSHDPKYSNAPDTKCVQWEKENALSGDLLHTSLLGFPLQASQASFKDNRLFYCFFSMNHWRWAMKKRPLLKFWKALHPVLLVPTWKILLHLTKCAEIS